MECTVNWNQNNGMLFVASTGSGHVTVMDGAVEGGGSDSAPRPMEMLLAGAGGCAAYDVVLILKRGRHEITDCQVKLEGERATTAPKVFTKINMAFIVTGKNLSATAVERAVQLSHEKYCSASAMLSQSAAITYSVEIREA